MDMDFTTAVSLMWRLADKHERVKTFHRIVTEIGISTPEDFWTQFWSIWSSSENLNDDGDMLRDLITMGRGFGDSFMGLEEDEREAFEKLAFPLVIYRGCTQYNATGWSWTHDRAIAEQFVRRAAGQGKRMIVTAVVQREDVLGYLTGRSEAEIVVDGTELDYAIDETFNVETNVETGSRNDLYYAVQSGRMLGMDDPQMIAARVSMMLATVSAPYDGAIKSLEADMDFLEWADLERKSYTKALLDGLYERRDNPDFTDPLTSAMKESGFLI